MHLHVLIPLGAFLAGSALAGAILGRGPRIVANRTVAGMLACNCGWAAVELMGGISTDREVAAIWLRAMALFALPIGPLMLLTLAELRPALRPRLVRLATCAAAVAVPIGLACVWTPWFIEAAEPVASGGWIYRFGPLAPLMLMQEAWPVIWTIFLLHRTQAGAGDGPRGPTTESILATGVALPLLVVLVTDVLLPYLGVRFPRLGTTSIALFGGAVWLHSFESAQGSITESGFARAIFDNLPDGVALLERDGRIRAVNGSLARLVGLDRRDVMGRPIDDFLDAAPGERGGIETQERETLLRVDTGEPIPVAVGSTPIHDRQGGVIGRVLIVRDLRAVTGLRSHLVARGRLAALGELAAGIAHEVNNPVAYIQANLNLLCRHYDEIESRMARVVRRSESLEALVEAGPEHIEASLLDVGRVADIVREVRGFAHAGSGERRLCQINELIESALRLAALKRESPVVIERDYGELPSLACEVQDLKQVFLSLVRRSVCAAGPGGHLWIETEACDEGVRVAIEDDGEPLGGAGGRFFTVGLGDEEKQGAALEFGICRQIVRRQGGDLCVEPGSRGGTRVRLVLSPFEPDCRAAEDRPEACPP